MCNFAFQSGLFLIVLSLAVASDLCLSNGLVYYRYIRAFVIVSRCLIVVCLLILAYIPLVLIALRLGYLICS